MTTYIPIVLLMTFSKIFEKVACNRLSKHLRINNVLVPEQIGFRKGLSTGKAACELTDTVFKSLNQQRHVGGMCCDLAEAVTVNYKILIN
jgi:hypothetical protein